MSEGSKRPVVRFTADDLDLFCRASHDRNPLHLSPAYARQTAFGEVVVFGILAVLSSLEHVRDRPGMRATAAKIDFVNPLFTDVDYQLHVTEDSPLRTRLSLRDGRRVLVKVDVTFQEQAHVGSARFEQSAATTEAADLSKAALTEGMTAGGSWGPAEEPFRRLQQRYRLVSKGLDDLQLGALLWASYVVGMEIPGKRALFSRLALKFPPVLTAAARLEYEARVTQVHDQFGLVSMDVVLASNGVMLASGEIEAFVREDLPKRTPPIAQGEALARKTALVIGASRGLGAAIASEMCARGATVIATYAQSDREAEEMRLSIRDMPGRLVLQRGDASDPVWAEQTRARFSPSEPLDILVCNATPSLLPLWVELGAVDRIQQHINRSVGLALTPMAAFLDLVAASQGWCVLISSSAVGTPVADWPHYVAAKAALEGLARVAALEYPSVKFLVVRPPKLLTDLTNTPLGRAGSMAPAQVAAQVVKALAEPATTSVPRGEVRYLDRFD